MRVHGDSLVVTDEVGAARRQGGIHLAGSEGLDVQVGQFVGVRAVGIHLFFAPDACVEVEVVYDPDHKL